MFKPILLFSFLYCCIFHQVFGQVTYKIDSIPFVLTEYNNIVVKAVVNGRDSLALMLHTASNSVDLTTKAVQQIKSIRFNGAVDSIKSWGGQSNTARFSDSNLLQIGNTQWKNISIWEDENSGQHTDGKFGINLFKGKVLELDYDNRLIRVLETLPADLASYTKMKLINVGSQPFIEADCIIKGLHYPNKFLIHSGFPGAILFDDKFAADNKLDEKLQLLGEKKLKDSYGNVLITKQALLPLLKIDSIAFEDIPVGFFQGAIGRQKMSIIGADMLRRFNIVLDAGRTWIYLKPNSAKLIAYSGY
jgi:hypothetical protein